VWTNQIPLEVPDFTKISSSKLQNYYLVLLAIEENLQEYVRLKDSLAEASLNNRARRLPSQHQSLILSFSLFPLFYLIHQIIEEVKLINDWQADARDESDDDEALLKMDVSTKSQGKKKRQKKTT
jgi:hypothetical protein